MSYQDHPLQIRVVPSRAIYTDNSSGADMNVAIYEPIFPEDGDWYFFGHLAVTLPGGHHSIDDPILAKLAPQTIVVRSDDPSALCSVTPDQKLWTDQHSGGSQDIEIYSFRGNSNWNYSAMGLFASIVHDYGADPQQTPNWNKLRAVRNDLVGRGSGYGYGIALSSLTRAYQDSGSKAHGKGIWEDMSIWNVPGFSGGLHPQTFMLSQGYDAPPGQVIPEPCWLQSSAVRFVGNAVWMTQNSQLHSRKLRDICLPATHDSGTFALTAVMDDDGWKGPLDELLDVLNEIAEKIKDIPLIGHLLDDLDPLTWILTNAVVPTIHAVSTSTRRSVLQQLWDGIRGFDFRVYYHEDDFYVGHGGVIGPKLKDIFADIAGFLTTTEGEIVYMTMGHWTHFDENIHTKFANLVQKSLGAYACNRQTAWGASDVFDRTYQQIVAEDGRPQSRVILVYDLGPNDISYGITNRDIFWPITYSPPSSGIGETAPYKLPGIYGFYTATTDKDEMLRAQKEQYQTARANNFPFALYTTLTPSTFDTILRVIVSLKESFILLSIFPTSWLVSGVLDILGITSEMIDADLPWRTLEELTQRVSPDLDALVNNNFVDKSGDNAISLLYLDYYENTKVVELAIKLSRQNAPVQLAVPIPAASDMSYKLPYDFYRNTVTYQYSSGRVWLCQNPDGTGDVFADDSITLSVVGPNGNTQTYTYDYSHNNSGWVTPQPPTDVTYLFMPGKNTVTIRLTDLYHNSRGCSSFYLVHESV